MSQELAGADLGDARLSRRLVKTGEQLAKSPASPINEACATWAATQGAYRLFNNPKAAPAGILAPHVAETARRMVAQSEPVLVMQDTVFFTYGQHPKTKGLGPIGKGDSPGERGLIMHNALAFTSEGVPLGLLSQCIWARGEIPEEDYQDKIVRLQCTAIEEKESSKWLLALRETQARTPRSVKAVTVADRESDFFEFLAEAEQLKGSYVIRARVDRQLVPEESAGYERILEALAHAPVLGEREVAIPGNGKRKARTATVTVRSACVTLKPPQRRGHAKDSACSEPIAVNVVGSTEEHAPEGAEPISWVLLTNLPVNTFESASEKVDWYAKRWGIETWHKVLKSGCQVEDCLLEQAERLARYLTLFSIIGVRLMYIAYLARVQPDLPARKVFSEVEIQALHLRMTKDNPKLEKPTRLQETVRLIGKLGGHLGRKCDGEPGVVVLWRGWMRLYEVVTAVVLIKQNPHLINSS
ncbi:MAG: IS4 family transposase [Steroidobacteraceae bacterium]